MTALEAGAHFSPTLTLQVPPQDFPMPNSKEYILRNIVKSPSPHASPSPQRMFAVITGNEFRLAAAFSRDPNTH